MAPDPYFPIRDACPLSLETFHFRGSMPEVCPECCRHDALQRAAFFAMVACVFASVAAILGVAAIILRGCV